MPLVVANWKMHGDALFARGWVAAVNAQASAAPSASPDDNAADNAAVTVVICPPLPYLSLLRNLLPPAFDIGAQNVAAAADDGAYTGEVSARMLADVGCRYAIVGHSERRAQHSETDELCGQKLRAAAGANIRPILCVGESADARARGNAEDTVLRQLDAALAAATNNADNADNTGGANNANNADNTGNASDSTFQQLTIAYEPIWAIGSGKTPANDDIKRMNDAIRAWLARQSPAFACKIPLLYGGSVNAGNAKGILSACGVDGFLVGGASLKPDVFTTICNTARQ